MSEKKRKLFKQTSLVDFMCGSIQSKRHKTDNTEMNVQQKEAVKKAAENREYNKSPYFNVSSEGKQVASTSHHQVDLSSKNSSANEFDTLPYEMDHGEEDAHKKKNLKRKATKTFRGVPLAELNSAPSCLIENSIKPSSSHTVLYKIPFKYNKQCKQLPVPHPLMYHDKWDNNHVRMPCSHQNEYPLEVQKKVELRRRWELIETAYKDIDIPGPYELEEAILSYNQTYRNRWNFTTLRDFFLDGLSSSDRDNFFSNILPKITKLALQLPHLCTEPIPLLKKYMNHSISMSQQQVACLLANAFLCTFPRRNSKQKGSEYSNYPTINFNELYKDGSKRRKFEKLKCIVNYFQRVTENMPCGVVTFTRQYIKNVPQWNDLDMQLPNKVHISYEGTIEDTFGLLEVDFANKYIGGGVLGHGCVQEEIRFLICPEMLITRLFTEELDNKECLIMKGCERFSNYDGYADTFTWAGNHNDTMSRSDFGRLYTEVVGIDALVIRDVHEQFQQNRVIRELNKAYVGFELLNGSNIPSSARSAICTGNWGCGAFRGDKELKGIIQIMAAAAAKRDVCYFTFGDEELTRNLYQIYEHLKETEVEIGTLLIMIDAYYKAVCQSGKRRKRIPLFQYILESCEGINYSDTDETSEQDIHDSSRENSVDYLDFIDLDNETFSQTKYELIEDNCDVESSDINNTDKESITIEEDTNDNMTD